MRRHRSGGLGFLMTSVLSDLVVFDGTVGPRGVHNYDLSPGIQRTFDHVLFVSRSYLPMNVRGMRRGGAPVYPHWRGNDAILEWVREQLTGEDRLTLPRALHEKLSLGVSAISGASRRSRAGRKRRHQVFLSYRGRLYGEALKLKERIERGEFHGEPRSVVLYAPQELALEDEVLSPLQRWNVLSIISDVIMECKEFWVLENPDYLASWWTRGELATYAYFGQQSRMRVYNLNSGELRDAGEDYRPWLTEQQKSRMSRFFTNSHPDMMAPESTETMRLIATAGPSSLQSFARDQVFSQEFWHYPLLQCEDCASRNNTGRAFTIEGFLRNEYPVLYPIPPAALKRAERDGSTIRCPNEDCAAEYLVRPTPPRYLWYPIPVGPNKTSLEEFPTYRILKAGSEAHL